MKKVWMIVALMAVGLMASSVFADVQNIRLSGDVRVRGYYYNIAPSDDAAFIVQRTRVTCEADLEDHVMVLVTFKANGRWGQDFAQNLPSYNNSSLLKSWNVGMDEAYVQMNQAFYSPATLKIGRQYLNYGRGLIISSYDTAFNFDAARLVLDYYPLTIDLVAASLVNGQNFSQVGSSGGAADLLFANARYELTDSLLKDIEVYAGWVAQQSRNNGGSWAGNSVGDTKSSPWVIGVRGDVNVTKNLTTWFEGVYEGGDAGTSGVRFPIQAFLANVGGKFTLADVKMTPVINASYTYASGGGAGNASYFRPLFDSVEGYNGFMLKPALSNIQIFNLGASIKPANNCTLGVQAYYYMKANGAGATYWQSATADTGAGTAITAPTNIGYGIDTSVGYDYSKDVRLSLVYGIFIPGSGHRTGTVSSYDAVAHGIRGELNVKF